MPLKAVLFYDSYEKNVYSQYGVLDWRICFSNLRAFVYDFTFEFCCCPFYPFTTHTFSCIQTFRMEAVDDRAPINWLRVKMIEQKSSTISNTVHAHTVNFNKNPSYLCRGFGLEDNIYIALSNKKYWNVKKIFALNVELDKKWQKVACAINPTK